MDNQSDARNLFDGAPVISRKYAMTHAEAVAHVAATQRHCGLISVVHERRPSGGAGEAQSAGEQSPAPQQPDPVLPLLRGVSKLRNRDHLSRVMHAVEARWSELPDQAVA